MPTTRGKMLKLAEAAGLYPTSYSIKARKVLLLRGKPRYLPTAVQFAEDVSRTDIGGVYRLNSDDSWPPLLDFANDTHSDYWGTGKLLTSSHK